MMVMGTIRTPARAAIVNGPFLNSAIRPSFERVPSGKLRIVGGGIGVHRGGGREGGKARGRAEGREDMPREREGGRRERGGAVARARHERVAILEGLDGVLERLELGGAVGAADRDMLGEAHRPADQRDAQNLCPTLARTRGVGLPSQRRRLTGADEVAAPAPALRVARRLDRHCMQRLAGSHLDL